jgi:hypothetical protein
MLYQCKSCLKIESNDIKICLWAKFLIQVDSIVLYDRILSNIFYLRLNCMIKLIKLFTKFIIPVGKL